MVTASVDAGAQPVAGGDYEGLFYPPTVLAGGPAAPRRSAEEIFGPVAPVVRVRDESEAVAPGLRQRLRALARHRHQGRDARPGAGRPDTDRDRPHQRPDGRRRGERPVRRRRCPPGPGRGSAARRRTSRRSPRRGGSRCAAPPRSARFEAGDGHRQAAGHRQGGVLCGGGGAGHCRRRVARGRRLRAVRHPARADRRAARARGAPTCETVSNNCGVDGGGLGVLLGGRPDPPRRSAPTSGRTRSSPGSTWPASWRSS